MAQEFNKNPQDITAIRRFVINNTAELKDASFPSVDPWREAPKKYQTFSSNPEYQKVITTHLDLLNKESIKDKVILELGAGIGSATRHLSNLVNTGSIIATEPSTAMRWHSFETLAKNKNVITYGYDAREAVKTFASDVDLISAYNCVHLFKDFIPVIDSAHTNLRAGGRFSFCTGFAQDSMHEESSINFVKLVWQTIKQGFPELRIKHTAKDPDFTFARTAKGYATIMQLASFKIDEYQVQSVDLSPKYLRDYLSLPGNLEKIVGSDLTDTLREEFLKIFEDICNEQRENMPVKRNWLHIVGRKE